VEEQRELVEALWESIVESAGSNQLLETLEGWNDYLER
jgi:hypothetical protein